jgi:MtfA peptidase
MFLRYLMPFIFIFSILIMVVKIICDFILLVINYFYRETINRYLLLKDLNPVYKDIIQTKFDFYQRLSPVDKKMFEKRVQKFISKKKFVPRGNLETVTPEMKALISASAIQITFGHPGVYFEYFWRILIYPDNYYSDITRLYHQGEVNSKGFIILSWNNFMKGYEDGTDGRNLGLHEMAHALHLENAIVNLEYDFIDFRALIDFDKEARLEMNKILDGESDFFRKYAASSRQEFFAITVEIFFEKPAALFGYNPYLYNLMTLLLLQDPLNYNYCHPEGSAVILDEMANSSEQ